jgi:hypothetical protein
MMSQTVVSFVEIEDAISSVLVILRVLSAAGFQYDTWWLFHGGKGLLFPKYNWAVDFSQGHYEQML